MIIDITCPRCNFSKKVPEEKIPGGLRWAKCPRCKEIFEFTPKDDESSDQNRVSPINEPDFGFSRDNEKGFLDVLWQTFKGVLFSPSAYFREAGKSESLRDSIAFGILLGSLGAMFSIFWRFLLMSGSLSYVTARLPAPFTLNHIFIISIIISPLLVMVYMCIAALVVHLFLMMLKGAGNGFEGTFKVIALTNATKIFNIIPFIGGLISLVWGLIVTVIGLREVHETDTWKAVMALLIPVCILIILGIIILIYILSLIL